MVSLGFKYFNEGCKVIFFLLKRGIIVNQLSPFVCIYIYGLWFSKANGFMGKKKIN